MRAGLLNRPVVIQQKSAAQDAYGEEVETWSAWKVVRARVRPVVGNQYLQANAQQVEARVDTRINIRYVAGIDPETMRVAVVTDGRTELYAIEAALHLENRRREIELMCRRQV